MHGVVEIEVVGSFGGVKDSSRELESRLFDVFLSKGSDL